MGERRKCQGRDVAQKIMSAKGHRNASERLYVRERPLRVKREEARDNREWEKALSRGELKGDENNQSHRRGKPE